MSQSSIDSRPNGTVTGRAIMIATGWSQLSNCAARIRYMNTAERTNATVK